MATTTSLDSGGGTRSTGNSVVDAILATAPNMSVGEAMLLGSHLESGWTTTSVGDGGTSFGPFQIHLPAHPGVSESQAKDPSFAAHYMLPAYEGGVAQQSKSLWSSDPERASEQSAVAAERPAQPYYDSQGVGAVDSAWKDVMSVLSGHSVTGTSSGSTTGQTGTSSSLPSNYLQEAWGDVSTGASDLENAIAGSPSWVPGLAAAFSPLLRFVHAFEGQGKNIAKALVWVTSPLNWLRLIIGAVGFLVFMPLGIVAFLIAVAV